MMQQTLNDRNKQAFIEELQKVKRDGIPTLIEYLNNNGFFELPETLEYQNSFDGGLVSHNLNVLSTMRELLQKCDYEISDDSIIIVALLHNVSMINTINRGTKNIKEYCENGDKVDNLGRYRWKTTEAYTYTKLNERKDYYGNNEINSYMILSRFISLTDIEIATILNCNTTSTENDYRLPELQTRYKLLALLKIAKQFSTYLMEKVYINE